MFLSILLACQPTIHHRNVDVDNIDQEDEKDSVEEDVLEEEETSETILEEENEEEVFSCPQDDVFPAPNWEVVAPEQVGMNSQKLQQAAAYAANNNSQCLVVVKDGKIAGEWYWNGTSPFDKVKSWSIGKSYASTVVGLAIDKGYINSTEDYISDYIEEWQGTQKESIRIKDMLSMSSGLRFDMIEDNLIMATAENMTARALHNPMENYPGAKWEYNNHTVQISEPLIRRATGMYADEFAQEHLWGPLGMNAEWVKDEMGHPAMYMNVKASCRDQAKFGYLFMKKGCWNGERVISEDWVTEATSPSTSQNQGYGYWWWLNGHAPVLDSVTFEPHEHGILHPFAPSDAFCAVGLGSQMVEVIPSEDLVVVRIGPAPHENLNAWANQQVMDLLMTDGKQIVHNGVLERVLDAIED